MNEDLIQRYLDDRSALVASELDKLIALLRAQPERAAELREQLMLDDLLAQKLTVDRQNFPAQVAQRIADFERGQDELDEQVNDLRVIAEAEIERPQTWSGSSPWVKYVLALSAAVLIGSVFFARQWLPPPQVHVAKVTALAGDVQIEESGRAAAAALNVGLLSGQQLVVPVGGSIDLTYQDATLVRVGENSTVTFDVDRATGAKQVRIDRGELTASIKPQAAGMTFTTPHAVATVLGTKLRLQVGASETLLDVTEGQVRFDRLSGGESQLVAAHETGIATAKDSRVHPLVWPEDRKSIAYLLSPLETTPEDGLPFMFARNPESGNLRKTDLTPQGAVRLRPNHTWQLDGGYLISKEAGPDLRKALEGSRGFTLEVVFTPASLTQAGAARMVALADDGRANFALTQEGAQLQFALQMGANKDKPPFAFPLLANDQPLSAAEQPRHLAITFDGRQLAAYLDGPEIARSSVPEDGWLADWREGPLTLGASARGENVWRGTVEALAVHSRCLTPAEVSRSAASYRMLSGREL